MKVLFCGTGFPDARRRVEEILVPAGHELVACAENDIIAHLDGVGAIIPTIARIDADVIRRGRFGLVQQFGVGLDTVDIDEATRSGVWVARVPSSKSGNADSVAELAIYLMIGLSRRQAQIYQSFRSRMVGQPMGIALLHKTACIVGMGNVGEAVAVRLRSFGMRLTAVVEEMARELPAEAGIEKVYPLSDIKKAITDADYIVLCINYHPGLRDLVSRGLLALAKPGAFLVNVARGGLVNLEDLHVALEEGLLAGAGLDVFPEEPADPDHPLFRQNVIATPHIAGTTDESYAGNAAVCSENILRYARGEEPLYAANRPSVPARGRM